MGKELGDSRLVALSGRGRVFTQLIPQKFTHLGTLCAVICSAAICVVVEIFSCHHLIS